MPLQRFGLYLNTDSLIDEIIASVPKSRGADFVITWNPQSVPLAHRLRTLGRLDILKI